MKRLSLLVLSLILVVTLLGCSIPGKKPASGIWYCEELQIAIDFDANNQANPNNAWLYADDGSIIPLRCYFDYGSGLNFVKPDFKGTEAFYLAATFHYNKDKFVIKVHHKATDDGTTIEVDDEKYIFVLTENK